MLTNTIITKIETENQFKKVYEKLISLGNKEYSDTLGGMVYLPKLYNAPPIKGLSIYSNGEFWQLRYEITASEIETGYTIIKASDFIKSK